MSPNLPIGMGEVGHLHGLFQGCTLKKQDKTRQDWRTKIKVVLHLFHFSTGDVMNFFSRSEKQMRIFSFTPRWSISDSYNWGRLSLFHIIRSSASHTQSLLPEEKEWSRVPFLFQSRDRHPSRSIGRRNTYIPTSWFWKETFDWKNVRENEGKGWMNNILKQWMNAQSILMSLRCNCKCKPLERVLHMRIIAACTTLYKVPNLLTSSMAMR